MPPVTPSTTRRPSSALALVAGLLRLLGRPRRPRRLASGGPTPLILPAAISSKAIDSGLRATDVTWGGMMAPRPSPSWPK